MSTNPALSELKRQAMSRRRAVIFDNDGSDVAALLPGSTHQDLIDARTRPAVEAGVDTYIYTTGWGLGVGLHDSRVGSVLSIKEGHLSRNRVADFQTPDSDCLRVISRFVKDNDVEFFWGMRMNDTHDAAYGGVFMPDNRFKQENPEVMFGAGTRHGAATAVDYLSPKVRDFVCDYIMDVVDRYDVDGVFLDFFRHPIFFRSNARGEAASDEERAALTDMMTRIKAALDQRSAAAGRYVLTAIRVPDSAGYCRDIGIDIEGWLAGGLSDILFTSSYLQLNDWSYSAQLGHRHQVPVYPSLDETRVKSELPRHARNSIRGYYGRVMKVWAAGCDGVLVFNNAGLRDVRTSVEQNWFAADSGSYQEALAATVKGRDFVNGLSKTYFASFRGVGRVAGDALPHLAYQVISTLNHHAPLEIPQEGSAEIPLEMADTVTGTPLATLSMFIFGDPADLKVVLNSCQLAPEAQINQRADLDPSRSEYLLEARVPLDCLVTGENLIGFRASSPVTVLDLWLDLEYSAS